MHIYDTFGFLSSDLDEVKDELENCLGIRFVPRESSFRGEYYSYGEPFEKEEFLLERNLDPEDGEPFYPQFSEFPILLHVSDTERSEELLAMQEATIAGCKLLKHEEIP